MKYVYEPFKAKCGCDIKVETGNNADRIAKLVVHAKNPVIDLVLLSDSGMLEAAQKGVIQPMDYARLSNYKALYDVAKNPIGRQLRRRLHAVLGGLGVPQRQDRPADVLEGPVAPRTERPRGLPRREHHAGPLDAAHGRCGLGRQDGRLRHRLCQDRRHEGNVVTFSKNSAQLAALFAQDEIWAAPVARFTWSQMLKTGLPLKWSIPAEGQAAGMNVMGIVAGSKNADLAYQLMDFWLSKEVQTQLATNLVDSPVNKDVRLSVAAAQFNTYGADQISSLKFVKPETILKQRSNWMTQWNKAMSK